MDGERFEIRRRAGQNQLCFEEKGQRPQDTSIHTHLFRYEVAPTFKDRLIERWLSGLTVRNEKIVCVSKGIEADSRALTETQGSHIRGLQEKSVCYTAKCRAFLLSSDFEGLVNVIIESFACGIPVVSTDCMSGPRATILLQRRWSEVSPTISFTWNMFEKSRSEFRIFRLSRHRMRGCSFWKAAGNDEISKAGFNSRCREHHSFDERNEKQALEKDTDGSFRSCFGCILWLNLAKADFAMQGIRRDRKMHSSLQKLRKSDAAL